MYCLVVENSEKNLEKKKKKIVGISKTHVCIMFTLVSRANFAPVFFDKKFSQFFRIC
jgi:hypothetical protein